MYSLVSIREEVFVSCQHLLQMLADPPELLSERLPHESLTNPEPTWFDTFVERSLYLASLLKKFAEETERLGNKDAHAATLVLKCALIGVVGMEADVYRDDPDRFWAAVGKHLRTRSGKNFRRMARDLGKALLGFDKATATIELSLDPVQAERDPESVHTRESESPASKNGASEETSPPRLVRAWNLYQEAMTEKPELAAKTDRDVYEWIAENLIENGDPGLPEFATFSRYIREGRLRTGQQKHQPRGGRTGRSVVHRNSV